jgi:hypothetical protein
MSKVLDFFRPKAKIDPVLKRLEEDKAFWYEEMKKSTREYMKASWDLAIYKQGRK